MALKAAQDALILVGRGILCAIVAIFIADALTLNPRFDDASRWGFAIFVGVLTGVVLHFVTKKGE